MRFEHELYMRAALLMSPRHGQGTHTHTHKAYTFIITVYRYIILLLLSLNIYTVLKLYKSVSPFFVRAARGSP